MGQVVNGRVGLSACKPRGKGIAGHGRGVGGGVAWLVVRARRHLGLIAQPAVQPLAEAGRDKEHIRARLGRTLETVLLEANVHLHVRG